MKYSRARPGPMRAITKGEMTAGRIPSFTSVKPNCTDSTAIPISHAATRPAPPPSAAPCTRAITGFGHFAMARYIPASLRASSMFSSWEYWTMRFIQLRSAPAQNDFPFPPRTMTRTSLREPSSLNASVTSGINSSLNALCVSLSRVLFQRRLHEPLLLHRAHGFSLRLQLIHLHLQQHLSGLLAAHAGDSRVGPHPELARPVGSSTHSVVAGAVGPADDYREFRNCRVRDCIHHLGAVFGDSTVLELFTHHEAGDVLQKDQGNVSLRAEFDEVRRLESAFRKQNPIVADDPDGISPDAGETADHGRRVKGLELVIPARVHDPVNHLADVVGFPWIGRDDVIDLVRVVMRIFGFRHLGCLLARLWNRPEDIARNSQRIGIVLSVVVGHAGDAAMDIGAAKLFGGDFLAGRGFHERRAAKKNGALVTNNDGFVAHRRNVCAACRAGTEDRSNLIHAACRHSGLIVENAPEVFAVREDVGLQRKKRAARIDKVKAGQVILERDLLCAQMLLYRYWKIRSAFDGGVVGHDHRLMTLDHPDAGDEAGRGRLIVVHSIGGESAQFEKRSVRVDNRVDPFANEHLATFLMTPDNGFTTAFTNGIELRSKLRDQFQHGLPICLRFDLRDHFLRTFCRT